MCKNTPKREIQDALEFRSYPCKIHASKILISRNIKRHDLGKMRKVKLSAKCTGAFCALKDTRSYIQKLSDFEPLRNLQHADLSDSM